ncbi:MAG TPA: hypothetical protein VIL85_26320 [Thermomicrobiales bacterium]|jgi:hypothetical protein
MITNSDRKPTKPGMRRRKRRTSPAVAPQPLSPTPTQADTPRTLALRHFLPLGLYLLITIIATYPLIRHFGTALPGDGRDAWQNYWDYWWLRMSLSQGQNPYQTPLLYAPYGAPLYLHTLNPFNGLVTLPIQIVFGLTAAYNTVVFLSFSLAAYFAYLLVARISGSYQAGFVGGIIYAFGSYHFAHLLGHANLLASEWLPAYLLCLVTASEKTGRQRLRWLGAGAVSLLLIALCDWQYLLFAGALTALYAPFTALTRRSLAPLGVAAAIGAGGIILILPFLVPTARELQVSATTRPAVLGPEQFSADLLSFVTPSPLQAWWGASAERLGGRAVAPAVERAIFLGFLPLLLAGTGLWLRGRRGWLWGLGAVGFAVLALGPTLQIAGRGYPAIPLPYRLLQQIPGVNVSRVPGRFALLVTLCLAILAGLGIAGLRERLPALRGAMLPRVALPLLVAALLAEHFAAPYPLSAVQPAPFYRQLAAANARGAVLELPFSLTRATSLFGQTVHGQPIVGGYLSRPLAYPILALPPFADPADSRGDITPTLNTGTGIWMLHLSGVRWIVVLLDDPKLNQAEIAAYLRDYAEPTPLYTDERMAVYRPLPVGTPQFLLRATEGWHQAESLADKRRMRWIPWSATLDTWSLSANAQSGTLRFEGWSFNQPRRLVVSVDGQQLGEWLVAEPKVYELPITLAPGQHAITFRTLDAPERPARTVGGTDDRLIAIGVTDISLR